MVFSFRKLARIFSCASFVLVVCRSALGADPGDLVKQILQSEQAIHDVQVHMTCTIPDEKIVFYQMDWGYQQGKEFLAGQLFQRNPDDPQDKGAMRDLNMTFDGKTMRLFRAQRVASADGEEVVRKGRITTLEPENFRDMMTPATLLGTDIRYGGRQSLGEALADCHNLTLRSAPESVDGHLCEVIEAVGADTDVDGRSYDAIVWVDPLQGYRPLRFEKYIQYPGNKKFKAIVRRLESVKLAQFDGVWFPVQGVNHFYAPTLDKPSGMDAEAFSRLDEAGKTEASELKIADLASPRVLSVDPASVKINAGIPAERFVASFPYGTVVLDQIANISYRIGAASQTIPELNVQAVNGIRLGSAPATNKGNEAKDSSPTSPSLPVALQAPSSNMEWLWRALIVASCVLAIVAGVIGYRKSKQQ
jgi:hypothetical protein